MTMPEMERERPHFPAYAALMRRISRATSYRTRHGLETALFVVTLHVVALLVLLHLSFVSPQDEVSCLEPFLSPHLKSQMPSQVPMLRVQVIPSRGKELSIVPLASFVFASQRGFLALLDAPALLREPIPSLYIPRSSSCFDLKWFGQSSPSWDVLLDSVLGYDTVVLNHLVKWRGMDGVLLNEDTSAVHELGFGTFSPPPRNGSWLEEFAAKLHILYLCASLFFVCTALIAFVIHETHLRLCSFNALLEPGAVLQDHAGYTRALGNHCAQSLMLIPVVLGMIFFLYELYKDQVVALGMLVLMSAGEGFSVVCARTKLSQLFYPPLFFCWFALFHIYIVIYPFGFTHVALLTMALVLLHTIIFFIDCFELPSFVRQHEIIRQR